MEGINVDGHAIPDNHSLYMESVNVDGITHHKPTTDNPTPTMRTLYLGIPRGVDANTFTVLSDKATLVAYCDRWSGSDIALRMDCRGIADPSLYQYILRFIEGYEGSIELIAREPVPETILSRFTEVKKAFTPPEKGSIWLKVLGEIPPYMRDKIGSLYGFEYADN